MIINDSLLKYDEKAIFALRDLYSKYGFTQYKMSKFEEYDLYVKNKDFLVSDSVITFNDTNGKLMALKPDVTLSIIKNTKDIKGFVQKFYYNENVYRVSQRTKNFKEIMQVGLECIGDIDDYCIAEVLALAARSLVTFSEEAVLDISHLGILSEIFDYAGFSESDRDIAMKLIGEKSIHEMEKLLRGKGVSEDKVYEIKSVLSAYGDTDVVLSALKKSCIFKSGSKTLKDFENVINAVKLCGQGRILRLDFSVTGDIKYYNGIVFRGFISGIPSSVLSGGQYDKLMKKMQKKSEAIGFAVYLDMLERYLTSPKKCDVDTVIVYDEATSLELLNNTVEAYAKKGSVCVQRCIPEKFTYKTLVKISNSEVNILENDA